MNLKHQRRVLLFLGETLGETGRQFALWWTDNFHVTLQPSLTAQKTVTQIEGGYPAVVATTAPIDRVIPAVAVRQTEQETVVFAI